MDNKKEELTILISVANNLTFLPQTLNSYLAGNPVSGDTSVDVKNTNSFVANYAVQIGQTGQEQSEIMLVSAIGADDLTFSGTAGLRFPHPIDTPVYNIQFDQIVIKRSTAGTAGTASALATVNITPDSEFTEYNDSAGASTYAYKTQYRNSLSGGTSAESDWFTPGGPAFYSLGKLRERSRKVLWNTDYVLDDTTITDWVNEWVDEMNNAAIKVNQAYSLGSADYTYGTAGYGTITEPGFKQAVKIQIGTDNGWINSTEIPMNEYEESEFFPSSAPRHAWEGDTVFRILPFGTQGTARFSFGEISDKLANDDDNLPLPLRSYTVGCVEYVQYRLYDLDQKDDLADKHYNRYLGKKNDFVNEMTPRDQTGPKMIQIGENLSGLNEDVWIQGEWWG